MRLTRRVGMVRCRVADTLDPETIERLFRRGYSINRTAELLGVNWSTVYRIARRHRIEVALRPTAYYGWRGVRPIRNQRG